MSIETYFSSYKSNRILRYNSESCYRRRVTQKRVIITNLISCDFRQEGKYVYNMLRQMLLPGLSNAEIKISNIKCK